MKKIVLLILASLFILSSCQSLSEKPRIEVSGSSVVAMSADIASFTISAECVGETTEEARIGMDGIIGEAVSVLKEGYGIVDEDLETGALSLSPEYSWIDNKRVLSGQRAYQSVNVTVEDISVIGAVVGDLSKINGISVSSINLKKKNTEAEERLARKLAIDDAMQKAYDYAASVGRKVGDVIYIGDGSSSGPYPANYRSDMAVKMEASAASYSTSYYARDLEISDSVHVVVELK